MSYSSLNTSKWGDCSRCPEKSTQCRKRGKVLVCLQCCRKEDVEKQLERVKVKNKVSRLVQKQVQDGNLDMVERQALVHELDWIFSRVVRALYANPDKIVTCYTCDFSMIWDSKYCQCGHFADRQHSQLRFDLRNSKPQCVKCNCTLDGNLEVYRERLNLDQKGLADELIQLSREPYKHTREELKQMLIMYRDKLRILENKFKK